MAFAVFFPKYDIILYMILTKRYKNACYGVDFGHHLNVLG